MVNYYTVLGVVQGASDDDIKIAYRRKASLYHPDKGGSSESFHLIQEAYDTLKTKELRESYNKKLSAAFDDTPWWDSFNSFEFRKASTRPAPKNADVRVNASVTLQQSFTGAALAVKYQLPGSPIKNVIVDIPAGIINGQTIIIRGAGETQNLSAPAGNLRVTVTVLDDASYRRSGDDLVLQAELPLTVFVFGGNYQLPSIDGTIFDCTLSAGIKAGETITFPNSGFKNLQTGKFGHFVVTIFPKIPDLSGVSVESREVLTEILSQNSK